MNYFPDFTIQSNIIFLTVFASIVLLQVVYVIFFFGRLAYFKNPQRDSALPPVSIIIAARNESDNLYENLPKILDQDYPNEFEVIVVNHQSIDDTSHLIKALQRKNDRLVLLDLEPSPHLKASKKLPLTLGIKRAKYEHLLFTDADCSPSSNNWLRIMAGSFSDKKELILGFGPYRTEKGFLNKVIRFDTIMIAINYFGFALNRMPYMGVGRNLAYTKSLFESVNGFKAHYAIPSGDDDLLVQAVAKKKNYQIQLESESFQYSDPKTDWEMFKVQKARHYTTSPHYSVFKKLMLGIYPALMYLLLISFVILLLKPGFWLIALSGFVFLMLLKWWLLGKCFQRLKGNSFVAALPFLEFAYIIGLPFFYYSTIQKKGVKWK